PALDCPSDTSAAAATAPLLNHISNERRSITLPWQISARRRPQASARIEHRAVFFDDIDGRTRRSPIAQRPGLHRDLLTRLQRAGLDARAHERARPFHLEAPLLHLTFVVGDENVEPR